MADSQARTYFVITLKGDVGPLSRGELREQVQAGAIAPGDRVRNAWGRPLGTVAEILGGDVGRPQPRAEAKPATRSDSRPAPVARPPSSHNPPSESRRRPAAKRSAMPMVIAIIAVLAVAAVVLLSVLTGPAPTPTPTPTPTQPTPTPTPSPPVATPTPRPTPRPTPAAQRLPEGWTLSDVGDPTPRSKATHDDGTWILDAGGQDFWETRDEGAFLHREVGGDFTAKVRLMAATQTAADRMLKVGLLLRADDAADAPQAGLVVMQDGGLWFQQRPERGAKATGELHTQIDLPAWLALQRRGDELTIASSPDGSRWTSYPAQRVPALAGKARFGLALAAFDRTRLGKAVFTRLSVEPGTSLPAAPPAILGPLPAGLAFTDVGGARPAGSVQHRDGIFAVLGGGGDIWGTRDECAFVHREVDGADLALTVRVREKTRTHEWDKSGVMLRAGTGGEAAMAALVVTHGGQTQFVWRSQTGGGEKAHGGPEMKPPVWLRLVRRAGVITAACSRDGRAWEAVGNEVPLAALAGPGQAGLCVTSHESGRLNRTIFESFTIAAPP